jgi:hypothetical protein
VLHSLLACPTRTPCKADCHRPIKRSNNNTSLSIYYIFIIFAGCLKSASNCCI